MKDAFSALGVKGEGGKEGGQKSVIFMADTTRFPSAGHGEVRPQPVGPSRSCLPKERRCWTEDSPGMLVDPPVCGGVSQEAHWPLFPPGAPAHTLSLYLFVSCLPY